jgi:hypothetical protein
MTGYTVVSFDPLRIQDDRGRFVRRESAEAACSRRGHDWLALWPDDEWIEDQREQAKRRAEEANAERGAAGDTTLPPISWAIWIPVSRWDCGQCGATAWYAPGSTPDAAWRQQQSKRLAQ